MPTVEKLNYFQKKAQEKSMPALQGKLVFYWNQMSQTFLSQHFKTTSELGLRKAVLKAPNAEYFICNCSSASSCPIWESSRVFVPPGHKITHGTSRNSWETSLGAGWRGILDFSRKLILLWKWQSWQVSPVPSPHRTVIVRCSSFHTNHQNQQQYWKLRRAWTAQQENFISIFNFYMPS